jgi:alkylation response protein AidB-like acyl-CoA dehydrogenase
MTSTDEQEALRAVVRKLLERDADPWPTLCDQIGVAGLGIPEAFGGFGAGITELQIVSEELGRALADVPFLGSVLAAQAVVEFGDDESRTRLLPRFTAGEPGALIWESLIDGRADYVVDGDTAAILLAAAETGLYEVNSARRSRTPAMDETRHLATVEFSSADARRIGPPPALSRIRDIACAVLAAEQAGAAARALEITVEYCKQRHQFGRPIGGFQAIKHRLADLYVLVETARSAAYAAPESARSAAVAKAYCSEAFSVVAAEMIQLHGGIAITWEHPAHRFFKRAHGSGHLFGQPHEYLRVLGWDSGS